MRALDGSASYVSARDPSDVLRERARTPERVVERTASPAPVPSSPARSPGSMADDSAARFRKALDALVYFDADASDARASSPALGDRVEARPGDRRDFLRRLASFRPGTWFAKPPAMGPVPCARRGWRNVEADVLECESCKARIILRVPPSATNDEAIAIANKTAARLDAAHEPSCGWRGAVCPVSVARFPRAPDDELRDRFARRLRALADVQDALPVVEPIDATLGDALARRLASLVQSSTTNAGTPNAGTPTPAASGPASALAVQPRVNPEPAPSLSIAPAAAESATLLALCGWEVVPTDATPPASAPGGGVKSAVLRCRLCERETRRGISPGAARRATSPVDGSRVVGSRVVGAPFPEEETEGERCGFDWRVGGRVQREHPRERDGARGFGGRRSPAREPGTQPGSRAPRFLHRGWRVALRRDARVRRRGAVSSPAFGVGATRESPFGRVPAAGAGSESPSAREGPRPEKATRDLADATTPTRTPTARARPSTPTETETDSGPSAAKRKRDDARNVAAVSTSGLSSERPPSAGFIRFDDTARTVLGSSSTRTSTRPSRRVVLSRRRPRVFDPVGCVSSTRWRRRGWERTRASRMSRNFPRRARKAARGAARGEGSPRRRGNSRTFPCTEGARRWRRTSRGTGEGREAFAGEPRETDRTREEDSKKSRHEGFLMRGVPDPPALVRPKRTSSHG